MARLPAARDDEGPAPRELNGDNPGRRLAREEFRTLLPSERARARFDPAGRVRGARLVDPNDLCPACGSRHGVGGRCAAERRQKGESVLAEACERCGYRHDPAGRCLVPMVLPAGVGSWDGIHLRTAREREASRRAATRRHAMERERRGNKR